MGDVRHGDRALGRRGVPQERARRRARRASSRSPARPASTLAPTTDQGKVQTAVNGLEPPTVRPRCTTASTSPSRTLGSKGERSLLLLSDGGDTAQQGHPGLHRGRAEERRGPRRGRRRSSPTDRQRERAHELRQGGWRQRRLRGERRQPCRTPSPPPPRPSRRSSASRCPCRRASAAPRTSTIAGHVRAASRSATTALVDFGRRRRAHQDGHRPTVARRRPDRGRRQGRGPGERLPILGVSPMLGAAMGAVFLALMALVDRAVEPSFKSGRRTRVENIDRYVRRGATALGEGQVAAPSAMSENLVVPRRADDGGPRVDQQDDGPHQPRRPAPAGR